ncbi:MAG: hypothetical protein JWM80_3342, partial [Cyanobacteria bacterium RYN_339]|nr:hypothetical protein [Cyanobacteria bacterium RYN_339]
AARSGDRLTAAEAERLRAAIALGAYPDAAAGAVGQAAAAALLLVAKQAAALGAAPLEAEAWHALADLEPDGEAAAALKARARTLAGTILAGTTAVETAAFTSLAERAWLEGAEALHAVPEARIMEPGYPGPGGAA